MERFRVLVADPGWMFADALPGATRGASKNYRCMTIDQIKYFPLPPLYEYSVLFLWRVAAMQQEALDVIDAWGFTLKTELIWRKQTTQGKRFFGMGRIVRAEHETCLIATSGKIQPRRHDVRSIFDAPVGRHSAKPEAFYAIVEALYEGPYCELFARRTRPGWTCYGDEI